MASSTNVSFAVQVLDDLKKVVFPDNEAVTDMIGKIKQYVGDNLDALCQTEMNITGSGDIVSKRRLLTHVLRQCNTELTSAHTDAYFVPHECIVCLLPCPRSTANFIEALIRAVQTKTKLLVIPHPMLTSLLQTIKAGLDALPDMALKVSSFVRVVEMPADDIKEFVQSCGANPIVNLGFQFQEPISATNYLDSIFSNTPALVVEYTNISEAAEQIIQSVSFDNGTSGVKESCIVHAPGIKSSLYEALEKNYAYILKENEVQNIRSKIRSNGLLNSKFHGASVPMIAEFLSLTVPEGTVCLVTPVSWTPETYDPLLDIKLGPVVSVLEVVESDQCNTIEKLCGYNGNLKSLVSFHCNANVEAKVKSFANEIRPDHLIINKGVVHANLIEGKLRYERPVPISSFDFRSVMKKVQIHKYHDDVKLLKALYLANLMTKPEETLLTDELCLSSSLRLGREIFCIAMMGLVTMTGPKLGGKADIRKAAQAEMELYNKMFEISHAYLDGNTRDKERMNALVKLSMTTECAKLLKSGGFFSKYKKQLRACNIHTGDAYLRILPNVIPKNIGSKFSNPENPGDLSVPAEPNMNDPLRLPSTYLNSVPDLLKEPLEQYSQPTIRRCKKKGLDMLICA